jgi:hypothetical protein
MLLGITMDDASRFQRLVQFRATEHLSDAIDAAANKHLQSKSEYIRQSVIENLKADGIDLARADGFDPALIPTRNAGTLYDSLDGAAPEQSSAVQAA